MACTNCYKKNQNLAINYRSYHRTAAYSPALDYTTEGAAVNTGTALAEAYDNLGVTLTPATGRITFANDGRYLVKVQFAVLRDVTSDATHFKTRFGKNGANFQATDFNVVGYTTTDLTMFVSSEGFYSINSGDYLVPYAELVGHTTGTPTVIIGSAILDITRLA